MPDYTRSTTLGKHIAIVMQAIVINADGSITYDAGNGPQAMAGRADRAVRRHRFLSEDVSALDANIAHYANWKRDWDLIIAGIKLRKRFITDSAGQFADPIESLLAGTGDGLYVIFTSPRYIFEYWGTWNDYDWPVERVKNVETVSIHPIDMGPIANPRVSNNPAAP